MILIFPSVYVSRILFSKNPLVRSLHYASRQPNEFLCFIVIFYYCYCYFIYLFFFMTNVYLLITSILINTMPHWTENLSRRRHCWFYPCFAVEKLVNCFLRHEYEKMTKTYHAPSIRFTHIWHRVLEVYILSDYLCMFSYVWHWRHHKPVHLWSSTESLELGFLNSKLTNLVKFETS